jgi:hypothetical protein
MNIAADDADYTDELNHQRYPRHPRLKIFSNPAASFIASSFAQMNRATKERNACPEPVDTGDTRW